MKGEEGERARTMDGSSSRGVTESIYWERLVNQVWVARQRKEERTRYEGMER